MGLSVKDHKAESATEIAITTVYLFGEPRILQSGHRFPCRYLINGIHVTAHPRSHPQDGKFSRKRVKMMHFRWSE
ncbi:unnamed protein product [Adineta steineri]|uniref:Uncharacterized protein n=1 Tax=Adineta steineri TaxID=433720 RepID=A0A814ACD4_9BILA|nr:unnamed protein product [Adineta steineri]CAF1217332.1 unnamed protein product [Adineta steineri]CAF1323863.1 unnamed protein product [Adineta steineri]